MKLSKLLIVIMLLSSSYACLGQYVPASESEQQDSTTKLVLITLKDKSEIIGEILSENSEEVVVKTTNLGTITIKWSNISSITDVKKENITKTGQYYEYNLQSTRYFFGPNGFGLKEGEGYYQNVWIFYNQISYGFTDYFTMGLGTVPLFLFAGAPSPVWITPKFSIPIKKDAVNIGAGALLGTVIGEDDASFGIGYGNLTLGNRNHNLSVSVGYGMLGGEWSDTPAITVSAMTRVSRRTYLITENYFVSDVQVLSFGGRSFAGKVGIDYGLVIPLGTGLFIGIPWVGISVPFGNY